VLFDTLLWSRVTKWWVDYGLTLRGWASWYGLLDYVFATGLNRPLFRVVQIPASRTSSKALSESPATFDLKPSGAFYLKPSGAFWIWISVGFFVTHIPFFSGWFALAAALLALSWLGWIGCRVYSSRKDSEAFRNHPTLFRASPFPLRRFEALVWLPAAIMASLGAAIALISSTRGATTTDLECAGDYNLLFTSSPLLVAAIYGIAGNVCGKWLLAVPAIDHWYATLPAPLRPLVDSVTLQPPGFPSATWRSVVDLSQEMTAAAISAAFFSAEVRAAVWRQSGWWVIWYMAPVVAPFIWLMAVPLIPVALPSTASWPLPDKMLLALSAMTWCAWATSFLVFSTSRDFVSPSNRACSSPLSLASTFSHPNRASRRVVVDFFDGQGAKILQLLMLALVPAYFSYAGLFTVVCAK
jgi:hypothetical protein